MIRSSLPRATALAAAVFSSFLGAQQWQQVTPPVSPSARNAAPMAFDVARGKSVLFGGFDGNVNAPLGDQWEWDGTTWAQAALATLPPARWNAMLAYDSRRMRIVLFGGTRGSLGPTNETWEFDGTTWAQRAVPFAPPPREAGGMAYDAQRGVCVLFGGFLTPNNPHGDCWEWDGVNWSQRTSNSMPQGRQGHGLVYDAARGRTMLFGGTTATGASQETWTYDGTNWTLATPANAPSPRTAVAMAFDSVRGKTVLHGGADATYATNYGDTWEWDGANWAQVAGAGPSGRHGSAMVYDVRRGQMTLFGGRVNNGLSNSTWQSVAEGGVIFGDGSVSFPHNNAMNTGDTVTIEAWLRAAPGHSGYLTVFNRYAFAAEHKTLEVHSDGRIFITYAYSPWLNAVAPFGSFPTDGNWHHVAFMRRGSGEWFVFVDGSTVLSGIYGTCHPWIGCPIINTNTNTEIHGNPNTANWSIRSLRVSTIDRYAPGFNPPASLASDSSCVMLINFAGQGGNTVNDISPQQQVGLLSGNVSWAAPSSPATLATYGVGCAHSTNTPALGTLNNSTPRLGQTLALRMTGLPNAPFFTPLGFVGFGNTTALGLPLPFSMSLYGMPPQCQQYVEPDPALLFTLVNAGGYADWSLGLPNNPQLLGQAFFTQGLVFDWTLPYPLPAVSTNAAIATIGL